MDIHSSKRLLRLNQIRPFLSLNPKSSTVNTSTDTPHTTKSRFTNSSYNLHHTVHLATGVPGHNSFNGLEIGTQQTPFLTSSFGERDVDAGMRTV
jgi:hypothetical protein